MTLEEILKSKGSTVFTIGADATLEQAVSRLVDHNIGSLVVCDRDVDEGEKPIDVVEMMPVAGDRVNAMAPGTWCPFNSQNTAFDIETLPAMYLVTMLDTVRQRRIGRMDDIWMSYFVRAIGDRLGAAVTYGPPVVVQDRNPHDFVRDLSEELAGYVVTEWLVDRLRDFDTAESGWSGAYLDLIYFLREAMEGDADLPAPEREYVRQVLLGMAAWHAAVVDIRGAR